MDFVGREVLADEEGDRPRRASSHSDSQSDSTDAERTRRRVHCEKFEYSILEDVIVLDVPARSYEPGAYEFPFQYQLPTRGLIPSFEFKVSQIGELRNVRACAVYKLKVHVPIQGMLNADLRATCCPVIREEPSLKPVCSVTESKTVPVYFCVFLQKGTCQITATLEQNVVPVGGEARVSVLVSNDSDREVDRVATELYQIATLNETRSRDHGCSHRASERSRVASRSGGSVAPGGNFNAALTQAIADDKKGVRR